MRNFGRCFVCLGGGHLARNCKSKQKCEHCQRRHHKLLCVEVEDQTTALAVEQPQATARVGETGIRSEVTGQLLVDGQTSSLLMTAKVNVANVIEPDKIMTARIVIDGGSHKSHVTTRVQKQLGLKNVGSKFLNVGTFGEKKGKIRRTETVQLKLSNFANNEEIVITACTTPVICPPMHNKKVAVALQNFHHLRGLELADGGEHDENETIDILIGQDYYWIVMRDPIIRGEAHEPVAQFSIFGWVLSGPINENAGTFAEQHLLIRAEERDELRDQLEVFWRVENFGISENEDDEVNSMFLETLKHNGERYEVSLPWRKNAGIVGDNFLQAKSRLASLIRKLKDNTQLKDEYVKNFEAQIKAGIIERVVEEKSPPFGECYYMPHHPVVKLDRDTSKVRIVYDASSKTRGLSLNQALHQGPSLLTEIFKVLIRFRWHKVALIADIEKAFLNISVSEKDRNFLRLLWFKEPENIDSEFEIYRFTRVVFGVTSSPYHLNATLRCHLMKYVEEHPQIVEEVLNSLYVDDFTGGAENVRMGAELRRVLSEMMTSAGFNMRKWATNSNELRKIFADNLEHDSVSDECETYAQCTIANPELCDEALMKKVLGVMWNTDTDEITYTFASLAESLRSLPRTKRGLLGVIARIYDPLGLVSPITIKLKASFQVLCMDQMGWDDPLNDELGKVWDSFLSGVLSSKPVNIPRCYLKLSGGDVTSVQLHTFVDASDMAYAAVSYLRIEQGGVVHTSPVSAKARVAPVKMISSHRPQLTTPRLELLAAVVGSKLSETVHDVLCSLVQIQSVRFWSDSMTVLYWIRGREREYKQFVENRLEKIRSRSRITDWKHVPGEENPADIGSRGASVEELAASTLWLEGPAWLKLDEEEWPSSPKLDNTTSEVMQEMKADTLRNAEMEQTQVLLTCEVVECKNHSSLLKLLRITAFVMRFVTNIKKGLNGDSKTSGLLNVAEMQEAETYWIRTAQQVLVSEADFKRKKIQFGMFSDSEGVIRCRSRMNHASMSEASKTPIALPHNHWFSTLIIRDCHERVFHNGVSETVSLVKTKYFIPRCRQIAKRLIRSCFVCRCIDAKPYNWRPDPPLPDIRVSVTNPFMAVGVDLAGPMYVKVRDVDGKENSKAYIVLFTCAGTRAVHLEMVDDCSSTRYIRALRRFVARRGKPRIMLSDNATNFSSKETQSFLVNHNIIWQPTISNAPWYGGMYERLIKVVKRCLKKVLKGAKLSLDELNTIVIEVEGIVNNRPLTYIDNEDFNEPITPNHLIIGQRLSTLDDQQFLADEDITIPNPKRVHQRLKHKQKVLEDFRKRWKKEYLLELRDFRSNKKGENKQQISVDDVVIIEDDGPRLLWRLGRITKLIESKDGEYRAAKVLVTGSKKLTELERPIRKLYPLELAREAQDDAREQMSSLKTNDMISSQVVPTVEKALDTRLQMNPLTNNALNDMISPQVVPTDEICNQNCTNVSANVVPNDMYGVWGAQGVTKLGGGGKGLSSTTSSKPDNITSGGLNAESGGMDDQNAAMKDAKGRRSRNDTYATSRDHDDGNAGFGRSLRSRDIASATSGVSSTDNGARARDDGDNEATRNLRLRSRDTASATSGVSSIDNDVRSRDDGDAGPTRNSRSSDTVASIDNDQHSRADGNAGRDSRSPDTVASIDNDQRSRDDGDAATGAVMRGFAGGFAGGRTRRQAAIDADRKRKGN